MSVFIGPCSYGTPDTSGERYITADSAESANPPITVVGDLDMKNSRIFNVKRPRDEEPNDAATVQYVGEMASYIFNEKVSWSGGTMTGPLSMGSHKLTNVGDPEDNKDAVNKEYVDNILTKPYNLERYIVLPHNDGTNTYFSVRARKKIDLDNGKLVELKHNINNINENEFKAQDGIRITKDVTLLQNPDKKLGTMELRSPLRIDFDRQNLLPAPWTLLFSVKPGLATSPKNPFILTFSTGKRIIQRWELDSFTYTVESNENTHSVDNTKLNHIALEYTGTKLCMWLNGIQKDMLNADLGDDMLYIYMDVEELGILSLYNRNLSKQEIVQHFVDHHVQNFTNDEVLI